MKTMRAISDERQCAGFVTKIFKVQVEACGMNAGRSSSLVRTLALRAKGRRFKSGPAHQTGLMLGELELFTQLACENCVFRCFKSFSDVFESLKQESRDS